jgi:hypothetical protein
MVDVQFEEDAGVPLYNRLEAPKKALIGFLINRNIVKDESQANLVLLGVIFLCIAVIAAFLILNSQKAKIIPPAEIRTINQQQFAHQQ